MSATGTYNGKAVREVVFNFEIIPNFGRQTLATIKNADGTDESITDAEALSATVRDEWKWQKSDGEMGAYGGFASYKAQKWIRGHAR